MSLCLLMNDFISSMLLALAVAIISDNSMIKCPCIFRNTFSSSSFLQIIGKPRIIHGKESEKR